MAQMPAFRFLRSLSKMSLSGIPFANRGASSLRPMVILMLRRQRSLKRTVAA